MKAKEAVRADIPNSVCTDVDTVSSARGQKITRSQTLAVITTSFAKNVIQMRNFLSKLMMMRLMWFSVRMTEPFSHRARFAIAAGTALFVANKSLAAGVICRTISNVCESSAEV